MSGPRDKKTNEAHNELGQKGCFFIEFDNSKKEQMKQNLY